MVRQILAGSPFPTYFKLLFGGSCAAIVRPALDTICPDGNPPESAAGLSALPTSTDRLVRIIA